MLDSSSLQQLKQLKSSIRKEARRDEGSVVGSRANYGFVRTKKGRQYFLPPAQMQRVFPGDRIDFSVKEDDQGREFAEIEALLASDFKIFCGKCVKHGNAWFVLVDVPFVNRKLFLPPKQRQGIAPGDWIKCQLGRHPIRDGKAQALVKHRISNEQQPNFPSYYASVNFQLPNQSPSGTEDPSKLLEQALQQPRADRSDLPLVSIDSPETQDIDDAICARPADDGWEIYVAIADPGSAIPEDSPLDLEARHRAATSYLPHARANMLPNEISEKYFSLLANERRPAMLCQLRIAATGEITESHFSQDVVRSRAQLNYGELNEHFAAQTLPEHLDEEVKASLMALTEATACMRQWRVKHQQLPRGKAEFNYQLNSKGRIEQFTPITRGPAQVAVEEGMVAVNKAAGSRLAAGGTGIFATHGGFRTERLADIQAILADAGFECSSKELNTVTGFHAAMIHLRQCADGEHLQDVLSRFLQRGMLSASPLPHIGLGAASYATFTSPLRRYADLHNHRQLRALLQGQSTSASDPELVSRIEQQLGQIRAASQWTERWLFSDYVARHRNDLKQRTLSAHIVQANHLGVVVRLAHNGIEGLIEKRSLGSKMKLDGRRLQYRSENSTLRLGNHIDVALAAVKKDHREILFTPTSDDKTTSPQGKQQANTDTATTAAPVDAPGQSQSPTTPRPSTGTTPSSTAVTLTEQSDGAGKT